MQYSYRDLHKTVYTYNKLLKLVVIQPYLNIKNHLFIKFEGSCTWNTGIGKLLYLKTTPPHKTPPTIFFFHTTNISLFGVITYTVQIASPLPYLFLSIPIFSPVRGMNHFCGSITALGSSDLGCLCTFSVVFTPQVFLLRVCSLLFLLEECSSPFAAKQVE